MYILLDPIILALPKKSREYLIWFTFVEQLLEWSDAIKQNRKYAKISEICADALMASLPELFEYRTIGIYLREAGAIEFDGKTVQRAISKVFENLPYFEQEVEIHCDWDHESNWIEIDGQHIWAQDIIEIDPKLYAFHDEEILGTAIRLTVGLVTYLLNEKDSDNHFFIATKATQLNLPSKLTVSVNPDESTVMSREIGFLSLDLIGYPHHLAEILKVEEFWQDSFLALQWGLKQVGDDTFYLLPMPEQGGIQVCCKEEVDGEQITKFIAFVSFLPDFEQSILDNHFHNKKGFIAILFRRIAMLVTKKIAYGSNISPPTKSDVNHHIMNATEQVQMDDWSAWRLWITRNEGNRIHYWWREQDNHFQLAYVVPHKTIYIPDVQWND